MEIEMNAQNGKEEEKNRNSQSSIYMLFQREKKYMLANIFILDK